MRVRRRLSWLARVTWGAPARWLRRGSTSDGYRMPAPFQKVKRPRVWPRAVLAVLGVLVVLTGLWLAWPPLALIVGGLAVTAWALLWDDGTPVRVGGGDES